MGEDYLRDFWKPSDERPSGQVMDWDTWYTCRQEDAEVSSSDDQSFVVISW